jgi:hypothetical protein
MDVIGPGKVPLSGSTATKPVRVAVKRNPRVSALRHSK